MSPNSDPADISIARYIAGECSAAEAREIEAKLAHSPSLRQRAAELRLLLGTDASSTLWDADRMWPELRASRKAVPAREDRDIAPLNAAPHERPRSVGGLVRISRESSFARFASAAAVVLVVAGAAALWLGTQSRPATVAAPVEEPGHYSTTRGQYATIQLTDGSHVTLAPQSRLTIPAAFGPDLREISLDGEAIFDVRHDAAHPFRVYAHGAQVEDIGTRFDLRAYADESIVTVAVAEGAVALGRARNDSTSRRERKVEGVVLHRGELGSLDRNGRASTTHAARVAAYLGWATGRLSFVSRPLPEVLATIGRWYDLDIRVPDPALASRLVTAEFSTQSADEMISALAIAMDASVERHARVVTLRPK
ncbi:MAG: FecR family protein [Gemmatimonadales bacterium]